jgi:putative ABC transport system permease protein
MYAPFSQMPMTSLTVVAATGLPPASALSAMQAAVREGDLSAVPAGVTALSGLVGDTIAARRLALDLMLLFEALALALSALGVYGVMSYSVNARTAEIGLRMAMGAQPGEVLQLIVGQGLRTALVGTIAGMLIALISERALKSLLYDMQTVNLPVYAAIWLLAGAAAALAMRIDLMTALRRD